MKRGSSGLSFVVGIDKPKGLTSHDVVGKCRKIFGEKRVGHAGTLDPMATGVLPVLVGSAARLNRYMSGHDKVYKAVISFGVATDTDDAEGSPIRTCATPSEVSDRGFAESVLERFTGALKQIPPVYSALKHDGKKACDEARKGHVVHLEPRDVVVYSAELLGIEQFGGDVSWCVRFHVSKGTYIRSLARDMGKACGGVAHLSALRRLAAGRVSIDDCVGLDALERVGVAAALDPVMALGFPVAFVDDEGESRVRNGMTLSMKGRKLFGYPSALEAQRACACTSGISEYCGELSDGQRISIARADELLAIYKADPSSFALRAECVFQNGVSRGRGV